MATIRRNDAGNWKAIIRKKGWPTKSKTFSTKRDAQDWSRRVEDEMVRGVYIDRVASERTTVKAALTRYLAEVSPTKAASAAEKEKSTAKPLLKQLGDYSLAALSPQLISEYRDHRLATKNRFGRFMSASQVRLELALLSHLFTVAIQEWGIGLLYNPVANIRKPSPAPGRNRRLTEDEERRLLCACEKQSNPMLAWVVKLALETAMRRGEIMHLRKAMTDLKKRYILLGEKDTKTSEIRIVPLSRDAGAVLDQALNRHIKQNETDYIFWGTGRNEDGSLRPYDFSQAWKNAKKEAGITDLKFHDLRHEAISRMVEGGMSDQEVAAISGHKTMQMLKRYTHLRVEHLLARLDEIGDA